MYYTEMVIYDLTIYTADVNHAGTDASVFLQLLGDSGKSSEVQLDSTGNNFEKGR